MKKQFRKSNILSICLLAIISVVVISCSKNDVPNPDQTQGKGEWVKAEIIIREGHLHGEKFHGNPMMKRPILPVIQKITLTRTPDGIVKKIDKGNTLKKDDPVIEVTASPDYGGRYSMEIIYYNDKNQRINHEFSKEEARDKYQHFFTINEYIDLQTKASKKAPANSFFTDLHSYVYRDTDPEEKMVGDDGTTLLKNPIGLKGYFHFSRSKVKFNMIIDLKEFKTSKFDDGGNANPGNNPSTETTAKAKSALQLEIPFVIVGFNGEDSDEYFQELSNYYGVTEDDIEDYILDSAIDPESSSFWM